MDGILREVRIMNENCPLCGAPMESDTCDYCGHTKDKEQSTLAQSLEINYTQNYAYRTCSNKDIRIALLLCVFFGILGVHRFYVGDIKIGLLYLFTGGILCLGWFYDIVKILRGSFRDKYGFRLQ